MNQEKYSIEEAAAIFIKSMANLVWILGLAIVVGAYLSIGGYELNESIVSAVRSIFVSSLWIIVLLRLFQMIDKWVDTYQTNQATMARYRER